MSQLTLSDLLPMPHTMTGAFTKEEMRDFALKNIAEFVMQNKLVEMKNENERFHAFFEGRDPGAVELVNLRYEVEKLKAQAMSRKLKISSLENLKVELKHSHVQLKRIREIAEGLNRACARLTVLATDAGAAQDKVFIACYKD